MLPLAAAALLALLAAPAESAPLRETARRLGAGAQDKSVESVAVLALEARGSASARDGERLAEKLVEELVRLGRVRVVERSRLPDLMAERHLAESGGLKGSQTRLQAADAVVTGALTLRGKTMKVSTRLVHAETGEILAAAEETVAWENDAKSPTEVAEIGVESEELRDAPNDEDCSNAEARVDRIEGSILDLKARDWAGRLRQGVSPYGPTHNPGSSISDPELKKRFDETLRDWYYRSETPTLTPREMERFQREDARALEIIRRCGLSGMP